MSISVAWKQIQPDTPHRLSASRPATFVALSRWGVVNPWTLAEISLAAKSKEHIRVVDVRDSYEQECD
ncbi:hypothetical protein, partial [Cohnella yongneupensis]